MFSAYNFCLCTPNACYNGHFYLINEPKATAAAEDAPGLVESKAKSRGLLCLRAGNSSAKQLSAIRLITISSSSSSQPIPFHFSMDPQQSCDNHRLQHLHHGGDTKAALGPKTTIAKTGNGRC